MGNNSSREFGLAERRIRREFSANHPAKEMLLRHARCRKNCAGREIAWPNQTPLEQEWFSMTEQRKYTFSGLIYGFICFDPDYRGWTETAPPESLRDEDRGAIEQLPRIVAIINECKAAATQDRNFEILKLLPFVDDYLEALGRCIMSIIEQRLIPVCEKPAVRFVDQVMQRRNSINAGNDL